MNWKKISITTLLVILLGAGLFSFDRDDKNFEIAKNLDIYHTLFRELNMFYVDEVNPNELVKTSIDQMLNSLDPYTNFISEDKIEDFRFMTTGEYGGIGAVISKHDDKIIIADPYESFPAQKSGLKAGDVILEIEGKSTKNMTTSDVSNLLKGPAQKPVRIKLFRPGLDETFEKNIIREKIAIDPVPYYGMLDNETAYIRLSSFTANSSKKVKEALLKLEKNQPKSLIFDLRSNPGGLLNESVKIVNLFVPKGSEIVSTKGKVKQWDKVYKATEEPVDTTIKIAVLTNNASASASEIVAGAMQDLDRGLVIGTRTFGKGLVQTTRNLSYNTKLKVTTAKYYTPSGRCIQVLDYSHRKDDGSVGHIPDSLITEFQTTKGRTVFDGGGIYPDLVVEPEQLSKLSIELMRDFTVFDFATHFANTNESIAGPKEFEIDDAIYNQFKNYIKQSDFDYDTNSKEQLEKLIKIAKQEKYYQLSENEFNQLKENIEPNLEKDLNQFRDEISDLLINEIVSRYYYQKGSIKANLKKDKTLLKAQSLLNSSDYFSMFDPSIKIEPKKE